MPETNILKRLLLPSLIAHMYMMTSSVQAQSSKADNPVLAGISSSFALPFGDLFDKPHESELRNLFDGFSVSLNTNIPIRRAIEEINSGNGSEGTRRSGTPTTSVGFKYNPISYWFASIAFTKYWDEDLQRPWNPDFSYTFGYNDWHPYTFSLTYANYGGNRLNPDRAAGERRTHFKQGAWSLGWKFPLPKKVSRIFTFSDEGRVGCGIGYSLVPEYLDLASLSTKNNKRSFNFNCKYSIAGWWYFNFNIKHYPDDSQQQPWDPDYTYGFGYFDWHPGTISVQYNNYAANRFPWNKPPGGNAGGFKDGSISISWAYSF